MGSSRGRPGDRRELTRQCEQAIRNYDPCISCSAHFLVHTVERSLLNRTDGGSRFCSRLRGHWRRPGVVIGVGNEFRRDDGAGPAVVARLRDLAPPGVRLVITDGEPTRLIEAWTGGGVGRLLRRHGYRLIAAPESFLVGQQNTLFDGEASRARRWGAALGVIASSVRLPASA